MDEPTIDMPPPVGIPTVPAPDDRPNRVFLALMHPIMIMAVPTILAIYVGISGLVYPSGLLNFYIPLSILMILSGVFGAAALKFRTRRTLVVSAGALLTMGFAGRGIIIIETLIFNGGQPVEIQRSAVIGGVQWMVIGYIIFVVWWRLIIPWTLLEEEVKQRRTANGGES